MGILNQPAGNADDDLMILQMLGEAHVQESFMQAFNAHTIIAFMFDALNRYMKNGSETDMFVRAELNSCRTWSPRYQRGPVPDVTLITVTSRTRP